MILLIVAGIFVLLPVLAIRNARASFALFVIGFLLTAVPAFAALGFDGRILSSIVLCLSAVTSIADTKSAPGPRWSISKVVTPAFLFIPSGLLSLWWSVAPIETVAFALSWSLLVAAVIMFRSRLSIRDIQGVLLWVFSVSTVASLLILAIPNSAGWNLDHSRFQGIYNNPNFLALSCMFTVAMSLSMRSRASIPLIAIGVFLAFLSGSRAGLASIFIVLVVFLVLSLKNRWIGLVGVFGAIIGCMIILFSSPLLDAFESNVLLRDTDSRTSFWSEALELIGVHWPLGSGAGTGSAAYAASSFLLVLVDLGVLGGLSALVSAILLTKACLQLPALTPLIVAAVANSIFESWLFTPGSVFTMSLWLLCAFALLRNSDERSAALLMPLGASSESGMGTPIVQQSWE